MAMADLKVSADKRVSLGKLKIPQSPCVQKFEHNDGSFSCRVWDKVISELKLELKNANLNAWQNNYSIYGTKCIVPSINERELLFNVVIIKNSAHVFTVIISSKDGTTYAKCKNYDEVNAVLAPIIKKIK